MPAVVPETVWRQLFESASEPQMVTDPRGRVLAANPAAVQLLDSTKGFLLGSSMAAVARPDDRPRLRALLRRLRQTRSDRLESEITLGFEGGETTSVPVTLLGLQDDAGHLLAVSWTLRPVGEPPTLVRHLQRTQQKASDLRRALDQAAAVLELDREGRVSEANEGATRLLGRSREEMVGCTVADLGLGPDLAHRLPEIRRRLVRGRAWGGEVAVEVEDKVRRWANVTVVPLLDKDVRPRAYLVLLHDVTRRRQVLHRLEQQRRLARLGTMAAVMAHEVRNPLAAAQGALEVIGPRVPSQRDREVLADVIRRLSRLNHLVKELLLYARPRPLRLQNADLVDVVHQVVEELKDDPGMDRIEVTVEGSPRGCPLKLDPGAMRGVLLNLLQNAAAATEGSGRVRIDVAREGDRYRLRVRDEGVGIPEDLREKVFEPFFTTRYGGSGLGLAAARHAVEQHGGHLRLEPAPGRGTDALVDLPVVTSGGSPPET